MAKRLIRQLLIVLSSVGIAGGLLGSVLLGVGPAFGEPFLAQLLDLSTLAEQLLSWGSTGVFFGSIFVLSYLLKQTQPATEQEAN